MSPPSSSIFCGNCAATLIFSCSNLLTVFLRNRSLIYLGAKYALDFWDLLAITFFVFCCLKPSIRIYSLIFCFQSKFICILCSLKLFFYLHSVCYWINVQMTTIVSNIGQCWSWKLWEKYIVIALFEASNVRPKAFLAIKWNGPGRTRSSAVEINPKANLQKCFQLGCSTKGIQYSMFRWQLVELNCACHFTKLKSLAGQTKFPCFIYLYCKKTLCGKLWQILCRECSSQEAFCFLVVAISQYLTPAAVAAAPEITSFHSSETAFLWNLVPSADFCDLKWICWGGWSGSEFIVQWIRGS